MASDTILSAKAWRYPGVSLGEWVRRSSTTRFHKNGDKIPPLGRPLLIFTVLVASLWLMAIYLLETMLMIHWAVAGSSFVLWMA